MTKSSNVPAAQPAPSAPIPDLALAMLAASSAPLVLLDGGLEVLAVSRSFGESFDLLPADCTGRSFASLGGGEWDVPQLQTLLRATASGFSDIEAYEMDLKRSGQDDCQLMLDARSLPYGDATETLVLLTILDVTVLRASDRHKDDLLRERAILLQEVHHRVANSLQIIASILMQSARKVQSEEARGHLRDAHSRVLSIAVVQKHLEIQSLGAVPLRAYLTHLCESLGASMISDHRRLALAVTCDDCFVAANTSVSLGLVVTELVINALKHAFPARRRGRISVSYHESDERWTLTVADDGVGIDSGAPTTQGLGSSIVSALAKHLNAVVTIAAGEPVGTSVTLVGPRARNGAAVRDKVMVETA